MKRREFIALLGGGLFWPLTTRAQQSSEIRRIGLIIGPTEENDPESQLRVTAFREGLAALGWTEGRNIRIDYRFGGGDADRIRNLVAELVRSGPDLIVANTSPVVVALKQATNTIPVVFASVNDPVGQGFISSLARTRWQYHWVHFCRLAYPWQMARNAKADCTWCAESDSFVQSGDRALLLCLPARVGGPSVACCRTGGSASTERG